MTQFAKFPLWLMARPDVSDGAKILYVYLRDRESLYGAGQCFESRERIASAIATSVPSYKRRVVELQAAGLLVVESKAGPFGANVFRTLEPTIADHGRLGSEPTRLGSEPTGLENGPGSAQIRTDVGSKMSRDRLENEPQYRLTQTEIQTEIQTATAAAPSTEVKPKEEKHDDDRPDTLALALHVPAPAKPKKPTREKKPEAPKPAAPAAGAVIAAIAKGYRETAGHSLPKEPVNQGQARKLGEAALARNVENPLVELEALGRAVGTMPGLESPMRYLARHGFDALPVDVPDELVGTARAFGSVPPASAEVFAAEADRMPSLDAQFERFKPKKRIDRGVAPPATHAEHAADVAKYGETFNGF